LFALAITVSIEIRKGRNPKWRVGKLLGSGACATVHLLEEMDGSPTGFAIKVAPIPKKMTKKRNSMEEVNVPDSSLNIWSTTIRFKIFKVNSFRTFLPIRVHTWKGRDGR
jgi:hypothetical protein